MVILDSSVVEQPAVNRLVAGSNPARGGGFKFFHWIFLTKSVVGLSEIGGTFWLVFDKQKILR